MIEEKNDVAEQARGLIDYGNPDGQEEPPQEPSMNEKEAEAGKGKTKKLATAVMRVIYDEKISKKLLEMIAKAPDPVQGIVQAVLMVVGIVMSESNKSPKNADQAAAVFALMFVMEMADKAGIEITKEMAGEAKQKLVEAMRGGQEQPQPGAEQPQPGVEQPQPGAGQPPVQPPPEAGLMQGGA